MTDDEKIEFMRDIVHGFIPSTLKKIGAANLSSRESIFLIKNTMENIIVNFMAFYCYSIIKEERYEYEIDEIFEDCKQRIIDHAKNYESDKRSAFH